MALALPALFPLGGGIGPRRIVAALFLPLIALVAVAAHLSLRREGGVDCLGWTASAVAA